LPNDLALTLASVGIDINLDEDDLIVAIKDAIAQRRGYCTEPELGEIRYSLELLYPERQVFQGRTPVIAWAWCLVYLMGAAGQIGVGAYIH